MGRALVIISTERDRAQAANYVARAPLGTRVEFRRSTRTIPQNERLHAMITKVAEQLKWHGQRLDLDDWKLVFMDALNREVRAVPSIDGRGFVNIGQRTSKLTVEECSELMDLVEAFAAQHGVDLNETEDA